jgi:hypothetical protein
MILLNVVYDTPNLLYLCDNGLPQFCMNAGLVGHTCNFSTQEDPRRILSSRPVWAIERPHLKKQQQSNQMFQVNLAKGSRFLNLLDCSNLATMGFFFTFPFPYMGSDCPGDIPIPHHEALKHRIVS